MSALVAVLGRDVRAEFDVVVSDLQSRYRAMSQSAITLEQKAEISRLGAKLSELSGVGNGSWQDDRDAAVAPLLANWIVGQLGLLEERLHRRPLPFPNRFGPTSHRMQVPA